MSTMTSSSHPLLAPLPSPSSSTYQPFFISSPVEKPPFHPHSTLGVASRVTLQSGAVGLLVSSVQNALQKHDKGAMGVFTRTGGTILLFTAAGFSYSFTKAAVANLRETDDALNGVAGGCAAGFIAGLRARSLPMAIATCAFLGGTIGTFEAGGDSLQGFNTGSLSAEEQEERRLHFFKKEPKRRTDFGPPPE